MTQAGALEQSAETGLIRRVVSIDIARGLTMALMIFVNDLAGVRGLPWWNYHAPGRVDAMTYVDMVFPIFLFIVGLSLPLAVRARLKRNASTLALWGHILLRSVSLLVLGLILANAENCDPTHMPVSGSAWALLALGGAILFWGSFPIPEARHGLGKSVRILGLLILIAMFAVFRRTTPDGHLAWIDFSYPEILGLIAFSYLSVCLLYVPARRWTWAPLPLFVVLTGFCALSTAHLVTFPRHLSSYIWIFGNGASASITMAGVLVSTIFLGTHRWKHAQEKMLLGAGFAVLCLLAGGLLTPLGISKIRGTPTWCLYSIAAGTLLITLLYWICDVKRHTAWTALVHPAGANTLLTYLLPDIYYYALSLAGITWLETHLRSGWPGVLRSIVFTGFILGVSAVLTRLRVRMQL